MDILSLGILCLICLHLRNTVGILGKKPEEDNVIISVLRGDFLAAHVQFDIFELAKIQQGIYQCRSCDNWIRGLQKLGRQVHRQNIFRIIHIVYLHILRENRTQPAGPGPPDQFPDHTAGKLVFVPAGYGPDLRRKLIGFFIIKVKTQLLLLLLLLLQIQAFIHAIAFRGIFYAGCIA